MSTAALTAPPETLFGQGRFGPCLGAAALVSLLAFEAMAVAAAMPAIASALDGVALYALSFGGMLATSVLGMVVAGHWCDRHGALRATTIGLLVFGAGLLVAGFADRMAWLVVGRILQGLGGGMLGVALYVGMGQVVPQSLHPRLFAMMAAAWVLPGLLGPLAAALLVEQLGWRSVFLVVAGAVPLVAMLLLPSFAGLPAPVRRTADASRPRIGWAAVGAAGALLLHAAGQAGSTAAMAAALVLGLAAALAAARRLLPRGSLVVAPGLPAVIALRGLLAASFASAEVFIPLLLTHRQGWSLAEAGLTLSAGAVLWSAGSAVQARITDPRQRRRGLQAGFFAVAAGIAVTALPLVTALPTAVLVAGWSVAGFGIGLAFPMLSVLTLSRSAPGEQGGNASALQLSDALCSSAVLAVAGALFALAGERGGYGLVLMLAAAVALAGALLARRAFADMVQPP